MTLQPFLIWIVGLLLVFAEFYLPGGVLGVLGTLTVLASIVLFALQTESPIYLIFYVIGVVASLIVTFKLALWRIRYGRGNESLFLKSDQEGYSASTYDKEAVGKVGTVTTDLRPGGHIEVDGKRHSANSQSGYIQKGEQVVVVRGEGETLIVKRKE